MTNTKNTERMADNMFEVFERFDVGVTKANALRDMLSLSLRSDIPLLEASVSGIDMMFSDAMKDISEAGECMITTVQGTKGTELVETETLEKMRTVIADQAREIVLLNDLLDLAKSSNGKSGDQRNLKFGPNGQSARERQKKLHSEATRIVGQSGGSFLRVVG